MNEPLISNIIYSIPRTMAGERVDIIVVDASSDSTPLIARKAGARVLKQRSKGKGGAMKEGARAARGRKIIFMDADNTSAPHFAARLARLLNTSDMAVATQWRKQSLIGASPKDILFAFTALMIVRAFIRLNGFRTTEPITGLRGFRKESWKKLEIENNDFRIETEIEKEAARCGLKIAEIYMPLQSRLSGSKFLGSPKSMMKVIWYMCKCRKLMKSLRPRITSRGGVRIIDYSIAES